MRATWIALMGAACAAMIACTASSGLGPSDAGSATDTGTSGIAPYDAGAQPGSDWSCLGQSTAAPGTSPVTVSLTTYNALDQVETSGAVNSGTDLTLVTYTPVGGLAVAACDSLDSQCASPVAATTSDDGGVASLSVPDNFAGYFQITGTGMSAEDVYLGALPTSGATFAAPAPTFSVIALSLLATGLGVPSDLDAGAGALVFEAYDCADRLAVGVAFQTPGTVIGKNVVEWYADTNQIPVTSLSQTTGRGMGGVMNVPAGAATVNAVVASSSHPIGSASVIVRAGDLTTVLFRARLQ